MEPLVDAVRDSLPFDVVLVFLLLVIAYALKLIVQSRTKLKAGPITFNDDEEHPDVLSAVSSLGSRVVELERKVSELETRLDVALRERDALRRALDEERTARQKEAILNAKRIEELEAKLEAAEREVARLRTELATAIAAGH